MNESRPQPQKNPRPLWPWVAAALVLCLFAAGFSFWFRIHQAQQLVKFARDNAQHAYIDHQHPEWIGGFFADETYLPWYDHFYGYVVRDAPISDDLFQTLCANADLSELALDISNCSPETIEELERQPNLAMIELDGPQQEIPLEWLKSLPKLNQVILNEVSVTPGRWSDLLSFSSLNDLRIGDGRIAIVDTSRTFGPDLALSLDRNHLSPTEAAAILAIPDLKRLMLEYSTSDPEFWKTLGRHPKLESLTIAARPPSSPLLLTDTELDPIQAISSLSELRIASGSTHRVNLDTEARNRFKDNRPDVFLYRY